MQINYLRPFRKVQKCSLSHQGRSSAPIAIIHTCARKKKPLIINACARALYLHLRLRKEIPSTLNLLFPTSFLPTHAYIRVRSPYNHSVVCCPPRKLAHILSYIIDPTYTLPTLPTHLYLGATISTHVYNTGMTGAVRACRSRSIGTR